MLRIDKGFGWSQIFRIRGAIDGDRLQIVARPYAGGPVIPFFDQTVNAQQAFSVIFDGSQTALFPTGLFELQGVYSRGRMSTAVLISDLNVRELSVAPGAEIDDAFVTEYDQPIVVGGLECFPDLEMTFEVTVGNPAWVTKEW